MQNHKEHSAYQFWLIECVGFSKGCAPLPDVQNSCVPLCWFSAPYCGHHVRFCGKSLRILKGFFCTNPAVYIHTHTASFLHQFRWVQLTASSSEALSYRDHVLQQKPALQRRLTLQWQNPEYRLWATLKSPLSTACNITIHKHPHITEQSSPLCEYVAHAPPQNQLALLNNIHTHIILNTN